MLNILVRAFACSALLVAPFALLAQPPEAYVRVPFPRYAPRPSAQVLVCKPVLASLIGATNESGPSSETLDPAHIHAHLVKGGFDKDYLGNDGSLRVSFSAAQLLVQRSVQGSQAGPLGTYRQADVYRVLSDQPDKFVAMLNSADVTGNVEIVSANRETGTLVLTSTYASIAKAHPETSATFYVCSPSPT